MAPGRARGLERSLTGSGGGGEGQASSEGRENSTGKPHLPAGCSQPKESTRAQIAHSALPGICTAVGSQRRALLRIAGAPILSGGRRFSDGQRSGSPAQPRLARSATACFLAHTTPAKGRPAGRRKTPAPDHLLVEGHLQSVRPAAVDLEILSMDSRCGRRPAMRRPRPYQPFPMGVKALRGGRVLLAGIRRSAITGRPPWLRSRAPLVPGWPIQARRAWAATARRPLAGRDGNRPRPATGATLEPGDGDRAAIPSASARAAPCARWRSRVCFVGSIMHTTAECGSVRTAPGSFSG